MDNRNSIPTNDRMIREAFKARLIARHSGEDAVIVEELKTAHGSGRLDLAVINGRIEGIEIKSDLDTLSRLPRQASHFDGAADRMTVVVGRRHVQRVIEIVPDWWTVIEAAAVSTGSSTNLSRSVDCKFLPDPFTPIARVHMPPLRRIARRPGAQSTTMGCF